LKVLAGHPEGRASLADLRRYVGILMSSGADWTNRMKRLAARAPKIDIFRQAFVVRDDAGWQITDAGRAFLVSLEAPISGTSDVQKRLRKFRNLTARKLLQWRRCRHRRPCCRSVAVVAGRGVAALSIERGDRLKSYRA
jgi:hypothetical protein